LLYEYIKEEQQKLSQETGRKVGITHVVRRALEEQFAAKGYPVEVTPWESATLTTSGAGLSK